MVGVAEPLVEIASHTHFTRISVKVKRFFTPAPDG